MSPIFYVILSIVLVATSQFLFKKGVSHSVSERSSAMQKALAIFFQPAILGGLFLNGIAAFFWLLALSDLELSYIFPFLALNYIIVPLGASIFYKEEITRMRIFGIVVICIGVIVIAFS